jgi:hypothetical protein
MESSGHSLEWSGHSLAGAAHSREWREHSKAGTADSLAWNAHSSEWRRDSVGWSFCGEAGAAADGVGWRQALMQSAVTSLAGSG